MQYVPDGFTPESYKKFKEEERKKNEKKNLGRVGPKGFKSRRYVGEDFILVIHEKKLTSLAASNPSKKHSNVEKPLI